MKKILLINPWIYDFAAYDFWLKPWGLLKISSILKKSGFKVYLIDTLDRHHPLIKEKVKDSPCGRGKYITEEIKKPGIFRNIPRRYRRYGLPIKYFIRGLPQEKVDFILVSSGMTYWYEGVFEAIKILKDTYKGSPIILGGTYATLCYSHAVEKSRADYVIKNNELNRLSSILGKECDLSFRNILDEFSDYEYYNNPTYAVLRISLGCPFNCLYCAQKLLGPDFMLKDKKKALEEIRSFYEKGIRNFAFYDDAFLFDRDYIKWYLEAIVRDVDQNIRFYTPNGLHAKFLTKNIAGLIKKAGFINPVLSLETADEEKGKIWHKKVTSKELQKAILNLKDAGYKEGEYSVYLMLGAPGSNLKEVNEGMDFIHSLGGKVSLSEFSPVPGTKMAESFKEIYKEPLLQNNSLFPAFSLSEWKDIYSIKKTALKLNNSFKQESI